VSVIPESLSTPPRPEPADACERPSCVLGLHHNNCAVDRNLKAPVQRAGRAILRDGITTQPGVIDRLGKSVLHTGLKTVALANGEFHRARMAVLLPRGSDRQARRHSQRLVAPGIGIGDNPLGRAFLDAQMLSENCNAQASLLN
jgi:hypothetical protein